MCSLRGRSPQEEGIPLRADTQAAGGILLEGNRAEVDILAGVGTLAGEGTLAEEGSLAEEGIPVAEGTLKGDSLQHKETCVHS